MARLLSLPDELLLMICANVARQETQKPGLDSVPTLNALARTNRRFQNIAEPFLYEIGHGVLEGLPILWAAHYGIVGTLKKSIAFGGQFLLDSSFGATFTRRERQLTQDFIKASAAWRTQDPEYWPPETRGRLIPTTLQLDVLGPTVAPVVLDRVVERPDHGAPNNLNPDLDQTQDLLYSFAELPSSHSDDDGDDDDQDEFSRFASPLHVAVKEGHLEIVKILLEHDVDINAHASDFCSCVPPAGLLEGLYGASRNPLHLAICSSRHDIAKTLIDRGAPIMGSLYITSGFQPIHQAAAEGHVDLLNYMLEKNPTGNVDVQDDFGYTPLYYAIVNRHWESTVPCLLKHGVDIDSTVEIDAGSYRVCLTTLGATCRVGRFEDALKLIELGADAELGMKCPPIGQYEASFFPAVASLLSMCCMRPRLPESPGCSPNSAALSAQQSSFLPQLVSKLLSLNAPQHWLSIDNSYMVHEEPARNMALWHRNVEALKALRDAGVDLLVPDSQGRNGLMIALNSPPHLFDCNAEELAPREPRREDKNLFRVLSFLLDCGAGIHDKDLDGNTVLHYFF
ncbi:ankyrin repeat-containing domain protein, partial [Cladorrhinum sp. PSN259]